MRLFKYILTTKSLDCIFQQKDLNLRRQRWMKVLNDYDCMILYHMRKANVVADALSKKSMGSQAQIPELRRGLIKELHELERCGIRFELSKTGSLLGHVHS